MATKGPVKGFRKGEDIYPIVPDSTVSAQTASSANTTEHLGESIVSTAYTSSSGTNYKGMKLNNGNNSANVALNSKGNLLISTSTENSKGHINLETGSNGNVQIKSGKNVILDTTNALISGRSNKIDLLCEFGDHDDYNGNYSGLGEGANESWAELCVSSRNIDLRCNDHGGIALQIAGKDGDGHENKLKFESDRASSIEEQASYNGEGGKGLEFGTFNNLHSSLYTGDYRFRGNGKVYGVTRETPVNVNGKFDYPTQEDDFKDIIVLSGNSITPNATWNEIIDAANKCKNVDLNAFATEEFVTSKIAEVQLSGNTDIDLSSYALKSYVDEAIAQIPTGETLTAGDGISITDSVVKSTDHETVNYISGVVFKKEKNGNVEISSENYFKTDEFTVSAITSSVTITNESGETETIESSWTENIYNVPASLDLVSNGKVAIKSSGFEMEPTSIDLECKINKNGKLSLPGQEETGKNGTLEKLENAINSGLENLSFKVNVIINNEFGDGGDFENNTELINSIQEAYPNGSSLISVDLFDLLKRVESLEHTVAELYEQLNSQPEVPEEENPEEENPEGEN